jgi:hypothetical protein
VLYLIVNYQAVRYLEPVALMGYALAGVTAALGARAVCRLAGRAAGSGVLALMLVVFGFNNLLLHAHAKSVLGAGATDVPSTAEVREMVAALTARGLHTGYAEYWTAYPITYLSGEQVIVAPVPILSPPIANDRYPGYTARVDAVSDPTQVFALVEQRCDISAYVAPLDRAGASYRIEPIARWTLLWDVHVASPLVAEMLVDWRAGLRAGELCSRA